jgi:hypothetical protein
LLSVGEGLEDDAPNAVLFAPKPAKALGVEGDAEPNEGEGTGLADCPNADCPKAEVEVDGLVAWPKAV